MSRDNKVDQYKSLRKAVSDPIYTTEEIGGPSWFESGIPKPHSIDHNNHTSYPIILTDTFEKFDDFSLGNFQEQASVKFNFTSIPENFTLPVTLNVMANNADSSPKTVIEVVESLVSIVVDNPQQSNSSLTDEDNKRLAQALDSLISISGEEENLLLTTLINFVRNLISISNDDDNLSSDLPPKETNSVSLSPHRHENVGRPASIPRLKLSDLLKEETDASPSSDIDTGPAIGNEVW